MSVVPSAGPWCLPPLVAAMVARLPQLPASAVVAGVLNAALVPLLDRDALLRLEGKIVRVLVRDAGLTLTLRCGHSRFQAGFAGGRADVTIGACAHDFALLAARREDPDTLFFARRLTTEGDTEIGLAVKNMLDAADLSAYAAVLDRGLAFAQRLRRRG